MREIIILAGPNGAGKTTFAESFLPAEGKLPHFINADLIAAGLSPFAPEAAALRPDWAIFARSSIGGRWVTMSASTF
jgi:predicted ABC-type ATPase